MAEEITDGRLTLIKLGPLGNFGNNAYIIADSETKDAIVVDAPEGSEAVVEAAKGYNVRQIVVTHRHNDHWAGIDTLLGGIDAPVAAHEDDTETREQYVKSRLKHGDTMSVGSLSVEVIHTPGHTPGSICLLVNGQLMSGDTLFPGGPGRTREPALLKQEIESIVSRLYVLPEETGVYPGHGANTTIGESKREYAVFASKEHDPELSGDVLWLTS